jgi:hypothetical protein
MTTVPSQRASLVPRSSHDLAGWTLRINGGFLLGVGLAALIADLVGYFFGVGPFASLAGQPTAIGSVEAHGLGALVGLLIWRGADTSQRWSRHALALAVHMFLLVCNLLFWKVYTDLQILTVGIVSTAAHAVFAATHLACLARAEGGIAIPAWVERFRGAGLYVRAAAIGTLLFGMGIHLLIIALGRVALPLILTPAVELLLTVPMFYVSIAGWLAWPQFRFLGRWHRIALAIILIYFPVGLPLHLITITTGSIDHYAAIPEWYSLLIVPVMAAIISCLAALRLSGTATK